MSGTSCGKLNEAQKEALGLPEFREIYYIENDGELMGYYELLKQRPYSACDACTGNCISNKGLWVKRGFRNLGLMRELTDYIMADLNYPRVYRGNRSTEHGAVVAIHANIYENKKSPLPPYGENHDPIEARLVGEKKMSDIRSVTGLT